MISVKLSINSKFQNTKISAILFIITILTFLIIPIPQFPLNDEWMYLRSINLYFENGSVSCRGCTTSGILLVIFGIIITKFFGFSFILLRYLILIFGSLSISVTYILLKEITQKKKLSVLASLFLLANPIFYSMGYLFMTDIPFLFFVLSTIYFVVRGIKTDNLKYFIFSVFSSTACIFLRQFGIALPIGILFYFILIDKKKIKKPIILISIIVPIFLFGVFFINQWKSTGQFYSQEFDVKSPFGLSMEGLYNSWSTFIYFGFFFSPLIFISKKYIKNKVFIVILMCFFVISGGLFLAYSKFHINGIERTMPYLNNIMNTNGLGAITIIGEEGKEKYFPDLFWMLITLISMVSSSIILTELYSRLRGRKFNRQEIFLFITGFVFFLIVLLKRGGFYDRYILVFIPILSFIFIDKLKQSRLMYISSIIALILLLSFSIIGNLDYIQWNNVRWNAINNLETIGIAKEKINGGFEFCLYNFGMKFQYEYWKKLGAYNSEGVRPHDWKFCPGDGYIISFDRTPEEIYLFQKAYTVQNKINYCLFDNFLCDELYILKSVSK